MAQEPTAQSYQKGDVYSFAIICQEVIYRMGVFYIENNDTMSPEGKLTFIIIIISPAETGTTSLQLNNPSCAMSHVMMQGHETDQKLR